MTMLDWIKNNKVLLVSILFSILQNIGVIPSATDLGNAGVSVDTKVAE